MNWLALALALEGNDLLVLDLPAGVEVSGQIVSADEEEIILSEGNERHVVPWVLIEQASVNGQSVSVSQLQREAQTWEVQHEVDLSHLPAPPVGLVIAASLVWPGTGQLLLGDPRGFLAYSGVEVVLLSVAAYNLFVVEQTGPLLPLAGVDALFRIYSAYEAQQTARKRRTPLHLSVLPRPHGGLQVSLSSRHVNTLPGWLD